MATPPAKTEFDYAGLPKPFAAASRKRAAQIKKLDQDSGQNFLDMGRLLKEQRDSFGTTADRKQARGKDTWAAWVNAELGWVGRNHANSLIRIYEKFGDGDQRSPSKLGFQTMKILATGKVSPQIVTQVVELAESGIPPTLKQIAQWKKDERGDDRPTPADAKAQAMATGKVVVGSDDKFYTPMPPAEVDAYNSRRDRTFGILDVINELATLPVDAETLLQEADEHWLIDFNLAAVETAAIWLNAFETAYRKTNRIIENEHKEGEAGRRASA